MISVIDPLRELRHCLCEGRQPLETGQPARGAIDETGIMGKSGLLLICAMVLAACGGGRDRVERYYGGANVQFASGPIQSACQSSGRKTANRNLCGCIQSVADRELRAGDQRMAAKFFRDPHHAQEIKMSKRDSHDAFWDRYKVFAARAERSCGGY